MGWVNKKTLSESWLSADIWFYPCIFEETFCLTALEAALTKTLAVTSDLAALTNTVGDRGIMIEGNPMTETWVNKALNKLFEVMENENLKNSYIEKNYEWAKKMSWENQANKLLNEYILPNKLEYRNMYGWQFNLPLKIDTDVFKKNIEYFMSKHKNRKTKILEVGTYAGTSLIKFVEMIPNSYGVGLDMWENYKECNYDLENSTLSNVKNNKIRESFYRNLKIMNLQNRIEGRKGDSKDLLIQMIINGEIFDFIYVDGNHTCLTTYVDLVLSWKILNKGGLMVIDDYLFNGNDTNVLNIPLKAVDNFLEEYKNDIVVLDKGYRVFIEKK